MASTTTRTSVSKKHIQFLAFQLTLLGTVFCGNVLIWPTGSSHWLNMKIIIQELIRREHNVTVLVPNAFLFITPYGETAEKFEVFSVPFEKKHIDSLIKDIVNLWLYNKPTALTFWKFYKELGKMASKLNEQNRHSCDGVLANQDLMARLQRGKYDVLLSDPVTLCGDLIALKLRIPFVYSLRFTPASTMERHCGKMPAPPSYVPAALSELTDKLSFRERIKNIVSYRLQDYVFQSYWGEWDLYYSEILEGSHWLNIKIIIQELIRREHNVTVLVSNSSLFITPHGETAEKFEVFSVPFGKKHIDSLIKDIVNLWLYNKPTALTFWKFYKEMGKLTRTSNELNRQACDGVLANQDLMVRLQRGKYDVLLADPVCVCGDLIALKLRIPFMYSLRFTPASTVERHCGKMPAPPSYVPAALSELTDKLSFRERIKNIVSYRLQDYVFQSYWGEWDLYYSEILGKPTTLCETMGKAEMWLIRTYWDFEFPRPFLPNFEFVGGLHCQPAKPLPEEMEAFVQSSGEHGIVVFSLGSLIYNLTEERSNMIALALSQIPQKVLWRYKGKTPETLGPNTKIYDWIPQNDLLGHPKTKAFITHGGTNGIYEAIYHGIPMVGIPMFADQPDNIVHMKAKGMAVELDFNTMQAQDLIDALNSVINNSSYKENAMRLSQIHHDQPMKPLDRAVFWIEFVMRHKGAKHLRPAAHELTWYQYHCLDVLMFLLACAAAAVFISVKCCMFCCKKCGWVVKKKKTE
nr:UDP-glucuronosyltransferase 2A1 isoform X6 [Pelodiscus sinensis]|eukprot:XP_014431439.1 UDP-glucuronosyltransferase 2A1 isoform X6 [Pelodiscus sinensis]